MFQSLELTNFQAHRQMRVNFDSRVTTIVGPSDIGKSSIVRALRWVLLNSPCSSLITKGQKEASVSLVLDDSVLTRSRSGSTNQYTFNESVFRSFRVGVPDEIANELRMDEIHFQNQHDASYWFCETAGEVSRRLNALVDLDIIDRSTGKAFGFVRMAKSRLEAEQASLDDAKKEKESLRWVKDCEEQFDILQQNQSEVEALREQQKELMGIVEGATELSGERDKLQAVVNDASLVVSTASELQRIRKEGKELVETVREAREAKVQASRKLPDLSTLLVLDRRREETIDSIKQLEQALSSIRSAEQQVKRIDSQREKAEEELREICGGVCPLCGGQLA